MAASDLTPWTLTLVTNLMLAGIVTSSFLLLCLFASWVWKSSNDLFLCYVLSFRRGFRSVWASYMPYPFIAPKWFWTVWIILVGSKLFWLVPDNFGSVQIIQISFLLANFYDLDLSKMIWTQPKQLGLLKMIGTWPKWFGWSKIILGP